MCFCEVCVVAQTMPSDRKKERPARGDLSNPSSKKTASVQKQLPVVSYDHIEQVRLAIGLCWSAPLCPFAQFTVH